ncbi:CHAP domain-containing protein [Elioraea thermophila]|uniref:CHAP domain-containing protein n=1 Tax=Elioraea thermophila TaxID=2185104 RepID=UPI000DF40A86|nr:CHAP domain-containing protein [Elioraea thermophila]
MRVDRRGPRIALATTLVLALSIPASPLSANPSSPPSTRSSSPAPSHLVQCVPFARHLSGIDIIGDARTWWAQAEGRYARGSRPEVGSVLVFRPSGGMRLGHVSVVTGIVSSREILVDHANWPGPGVPKGRIARGVSVIDVSPGNDWTAVRVEIHGRGSDYGRTYATWGFIYPRDPAGRPITDRQPLPERVERATQRAAAAAARSPAYVGRLGGSRDESQIVELAEATGRPARAGVAGTLATAEASPRRDFGEDIAAWGAPNRSLR